MTHHTGSDEGRNGATRNPDRIEPMLAALREAWERNPDQRLTQLVYNVARTARSLPPCPGLFYLEDGAFLDALAAHLPHPAADPSDGAAT